MDTESFEQRHQDFFWYKKLQEKGLTDEMFSRKENWTFVLMNITEF